MKMKARSMIAPMQSTQGTLEHVQTAVYKSRESKNGDGSVIPPCAISQRLKSIRKLFRAADRGLVQRTGAQRRKVFFPRVMDGVVGVSHLH